MKTQVCLGQPSWQFASDKVQASVTRTGGHLAPVRFALPHRTVQPFSVAPWASERPRQRGLPGVLQALRGDFFCAFFGGNETPYRGERHPPHGETANARWRFRSLCRQAGTETLHLSMQPKVRPGRVEKVLSVRDGQTAVYCRHIVSEMSGVANPGHHATLRFPDRPASGNISTSRIRFAQVLPSAFEDPAKGGYSCLRPGATFSRLDRVPAADGTYADVSRYPARRGFEDLLMLVHEARPDFAWTAVTFPREGYVWFSLKDPRVLRHTVFWISNGGRHYAPWNGRHVNVMGLEDVTAYFHYGVAESARPNPLSRRGLPTSIRLQPKQPLVINYIMAVAAIPRGFERVRRIIPDTDRVHLISNKGARIPVALEPAFLYEKP